MHPVLGVFFISKPTLDNVSAIKAILRSFELVSGLRINFAKSQFGAIGQSEEWCTLAADILNCGPLQFPFIYLGMPIGVNPRRKVVWEPLIRKLEAKLNKWNQRSLSMAGRITLINVVLTALPLFYMSFFRAPTAIIKRLTAIQRQFLWGGNLEGKKIAWVAWNQVCAPKEKGGLGVKDIKAFNRALLIKWKWLMFQQQDHLWSRILTSKYRGWRGLEEGPPKQIFSSWWSDLRSVTQHSSMAAVNKHFRWNLGSGDQILFWEDSWVGEGIALKDKYPDLYQVTSQKLKTVASMGIFGEHGWEWQFSWRRCLFDSELGGVSAFIDQTAVINTNAALGDSWVWGAEPSGIFSTNSAYNCIKADQLPSQPITGFRQLWEIKIPPTALAFAWRLLWDRLPSKENLIRRQIVLQNDLCPFCQSQVESASHLFFSCHKIMPLWWEFYSWVKEVRALHSNPMENFLQHCSLAASRNSNRRRKVWWIVATRSIWNLRNDMIFNNQPFVISKLVDNSIFLTWSWLRGWEKDFNVPFHQWSSNMSLSFS